MRLYDIFTCYKLKGFSGASPYSVVLQGILCASSGYESIVFDLNRWCNESTPYTPDLDRSKRIRIRESETWSIFAPMPLLKIKDSKYRSNSTPAFMHGMISSHNCLGAWWLCFLWWETSREIGTAVLQYLERVSDVWVLWTCHEKSLMTRRSRDELHKCQAP